MWLWQSSTNVILSLSPGRGPTSRNYLPQVTVRDYIRNYLVVTEQHKHYFISQSLLTSRNYLPQVTVRDYIRNYLVVTEHHQHTSRNYLPQVMLCEYVLTWIDRASYTYFE